MTLLDLRLLLQKLRAQSPLHWQNQLLLLVLLLPSQNCEMSVHGCWSDAYGGAYDDGGADCGYDDHGNENVILNVIWPELERQRVQPAQLEKGWDYDSNCVQKSQRIVHRYLWQ